jgi:drug/metabolite transporter (DMT)-like permease
VTFYIFVLSRKRIQEESHPQVSTIIWLKNFTIGFVGYNVSAHYSLLGLNYMTASIERILLFVYPTFILILRAILLKKQTTRLQ